MNSPPPLRPSRLSHYCFFGIPNWFGVTAAPPLLLLSAASSSFQAGPELLKALARQHDPAHRSDQVIEAGTAILPRVWGATNRHRTPYWAAMLFFGISAAATIAAGGEYQRLVLIYAMFLSFLARFSARQRHIDQLVVNIVGALALAFTWAVNLARREPVASLGTVVVIAAKAVHALGAGGVALGASATSPARRSRPAE